MKSFKKVLAVVVLSLVVPSANAALELIAENNTTSYVHSSGIVSFSHTYDLNNSYESVSLFFDTEDGYYASYMHVELFIDGNQILDWGGSTYINDAPNIVALGSMGYKLYGDVAIEQSLWESITTDDQITVSWNQYNVGDPWNTGNYVAFELYGNVSAVPETSALALIIGGLGLVGFMATRARNEKD